MTPEDRANAWLMAWDGQGIHRTGTAGDDASAEWLAAEAARLGADPVIHEFPIDRLDPVETAVEIGSVRFEAVPVFDSPPCGWISGRLGPVGGGADIGVAELSPRVVYTPAWRQLREEPGQRALVVVCAGERPGLGLLNAEQYRAPYGAPAVQVSSEDGVAVLEAMGSGAEARVISRYTQRRGLAHNVEVILRGRDRSRQPLVVMTPRSSWWQSTSERGGGLVCWLETLRALLADPPGCDVVFTANSGHELGHLGLDAFQARRPGWDRHAGAIWVHYGANIGAVGGRLSIMSATEALRAAMAAALAGAGQPADEMAPPTVVPSGETRDIHRAGGQYVTLVGTNPLFHLPADRWPHAVDVPAITRIAAGAAAMVRGLTR